GELALVGGPDLGHGQHGRVLVPLGVAQHVVGEGVARGLALKDEGTANELVTRLIETVAANFASELRRVGAMRPGDTVDPLKGMVVGHIGTVGLVSESGDGGNIYQR